MFYVSYCPADKEDVEKRFFWQITSLLLVLGFPSSVAQQTQPSIAHRILDEEARWLRLDEGSVQRSKDFVSRILSRARQEIGVNETSSRDEALRVFEQIGDLLVSEGLLVRSCNLLTNAFQKQPLDWEIRDLVGTLTSGDLDPNQTLDEDYCTLDEWSFYEDNRHQIEDIAGRCDEEFCFGDCDSFSVLYYAIGQELGLPIEMTILPGHVLVRWRLDNGDYVYWETLERRAVTEADFRTQWAFDDVSIENGVYLSGLTEGEILSHYYTSIAVARMQSGDRAWARRLLNRAIRSNPNNTLAYHNRAILAANDVGPDGSALPGAQKAALLDLARILELDPLGHIGTVHLFRGDILREMGRIETAIPAYDRTIEYGREQVKALGYYGRALAKIDEGRAPGTQILQDLDRTIELLSSESSFEDEVTLDARMRRAQIHVDRGDFRSALRDVEILDQYLSRREMGHLEARTYFGLENYTRALDTISGVIRDENFRSERNPESYLLRAEIYERMGESEKARNDREEANRIRSG